MPTQVFHHGKYVDVRYVGVKFSTLARRGDIASKNSVIATSEWTKRIAQAIVPYRKGRLSKTGRIERGGANEGSSLTAHKGRNVYYVTFGGGGVEYAVLQHEEMDFNHPGGRQAKYLQKALEMANEQGILSQALINRIGMITKIQALEVAPAP